MISFLHSFASKEFSTPRSVSTSLMSLRSICSDWCMTSSDKLIKRQTREKTSTSSFICHYALYLLHMPLSRRVWKTWRNKKPNSAEIWEKKSERRETMALTNSLTRCLGWHSRRWLSNRLLKYWDLFWTASPACLRNGLKHSHLYLLGLPCTNMMSWSRRFSSRNLICEMISQEYISFYQTFVIRSSRLRVLNQPLMKKNS